MKKNLVSMLLLSATLALSSGAMAWADETAAKSTANLSLAGSETEAAQTDTASADEPGASPQTAIDPEDTAQEKPAPLGTWVNFAVYSTADSAYHNLQMRIRRCYTYSENPDVIDGAIALNNSLDEYSTIDTSDLKLPSDVELALVQYEVSIPADFPAGDYGLYDLDVYLYAQAPDGGGIPSADGASSYIGLGSTTYLKTENFGDSNTNFMPGNTYTAYALYEMVQGYKDYEFYATTYPDGTKDTSGDLLIYTYFASNESTAAAAAETETPPTQEETSLSADDAAAAFQNSLDAAE